jgi:hypothetical protein
VPPHERVGSDHGEKLSPVDQPREQDKCDSGCIVEAPRLDLPLNVECQLFPKEEILGCEAGVGRTRQHHEAQEITDEKK